MESIHLEIKTTTHELKAIIYDKWNKAYLSPKTYHIYLITGHGEPETAATGCAAPSLAYRASGSPTRQQATALRLT